MNQETIKVELRVVDESDILSFYLDDENYPEGLTVNLNSSSSQAELKSVFIKLLELINENLIKLELEIAEGYTKGLYKEVCKEYINDLNQEIKQVHNELVEVLSIEE